MVLQRVYFGIIFSIYHLMLGNFLYAQAPMTTIHIHNAQPSHAHFHFSEGIVGLNAHSKRSILEVTEDGPGSCIMRGYEYARAGGALLAHSATRIGSYILRHPAVASVSVSAALCLYMHYELGKIKTYLLEQKRWFRWKDEISLVVSAQLPSEALKKEVFLRFCMMGDRSAEAVSADGDILAIVIQELQAEAEMCERYEKLMSIVSWFDSIQRGIVAAGSMYIPRILGGEMLTAAFHMASATFGSVVFAHSDRIIAQECSVWRRRLLLLEALIASLCNT